MGEEFLHHLVQSAEFFCFLRVAVGYCFNLYHLLQLQSIIHGTLFVLTAVVDGSLFGKQQCPDQGKQNR